MADKKLESFKIGAQQGKPVSKGPGKSAQAPETESISLGFTRIESILDSEDREDVGRGLAELLGSLDTFSTAATNNKDKAAAKKAIAAVELTVDLMDYLYQTKAQLQTEGDS